MPPPTDTRLGCSLRGVERENRLARVAKAGSDVWGQAVLRVLAEVEALAAERADAVMAELLAEEAKPGGVAG